MKVNGWYGMSAAAILWLSWVSLGSSADLRLDPKTSKIDVAVKATGDDFVAHLDKYQAAIAVDDQSGQPNAAEVTWDFKDLKTGNVKRDKAMLKWLEQDKDGGASFTLTDWKLSPGQSTAVGRLAMHGRTNSVTMPVHFQCQEDQVTIKGTADFDHREWGLEVYTMLLVLRVDPHLHVDFELKGTLPKQ